MIATGFNGNSSRSNAVADRQPEEKIPSRKPYFKVEELPEDLEMKVVNPAELEEEARQKRFRLEEERKRKQRKEYNRRTDGGQRGINDLPDTNGLLKRKIGTLFGDEE